MDDAGKETDRLDSQRVFYHKLGTTQDQDILIYQNQDQPDWMPIPAMSLDGNYLFIYVVKDTNPTYLLSYHTWSVIKSSRSISPRSILDS